jgi:hypothetical protein
VAIGRKHLSVIICTYELLSFYNTHVPLDAPFLLCMEHIYAKGSENQKCIFCESLLYFPQSAGKAEPQCEATPVDLGSPHFCGAWQYEFSQCFTSYRFTMIRPIFSVCHAWGGCMWWHKHVPQALQTHQRVESQTVKLDPAPRQCQSPSPIYRVHGR